MTQHRRNITLADFEMAAHFVGLNIRAANDEGKRAMVSALLDFKSGLPGEDRPKAERTMHDAIDCDTFDGRTHRKCQYLVGHSGSHFDGDDFF
jgi:hypothetical protein